MELEAEQQRASERARRANDRRWMTVFLRRGESEHAL